MTHYRYGATLRPFTQLNLRRLEACEHSYSQHGRYPAHGTMAFHRPLTDFEVKQLDLVFLTEEEGPC
jgi:hypothetical protein